jgi:hypothetical protein
MLLLVGLLRDGEAACEQARGKESLLPNLP